MSGGGQRRPDHATTGGVGDPEWAALLEVSPRREVAVAALHDLALRAASSELGRRAAAAGLSTRDRDDMARDAAADAVLAVLRKLGEFRGDSKFTTWVYKFVVLEVSHNLARHYRRSAPVLLPEPAAWERFEQRMGLDPALNAEAGELAGALRRAVSTLTPRQREIFVEIVVREVPLDAVVDRRQTNRNAIYKVVFDARRKIRAALVADGYLEAGGRR